MLTCKEASFLASKKLDAKLTRTERIGFCLHLWMCKLCQRYNRDIQAMHQAMRNTNDRNSVSAPDSVKLPDERKQRMKQVLDKAVNEKS